MGRGSLDNEELLTVLCDYVIVVNSRPLTYISDDIDEEFSIKSEKLLHEIPESCVADINNVDKVKLSKRTKYLQRIRETLILRFRAEYLGQLRQQSIKYYKHEAVEIVLLEDTIKTFLLESNSCLKSYTGLRCQIRLVFIKINNSELLRSVQQLYRLEMENPIEEINDETMPLTISSGRIIKAPVR